MWTIYTHISLLDAGPWPLAYKRWYEFQCVYKQNTYSILYVSFFILYVSFFVMPDCLQAMMICMYWLWPVLRLLWGHTHKHTHTHTHKRMHTHTRTQMIGSDVRASLPPFFFFLFLFLFFLLAQPPGPARYQEKAKPHFISILFFISHLVRPSMRASTLICAVLHNQNVQCFCKYNNEAQRK